MSDGGGGADYIKKPGRTSRLHWLNPVGGAGMHPYVD